MPESVYFKDEELRCPCCYMNRMAMDFLSLMDSLRVACNMPLVSHSAYRCEKHNTAVGGKPNSAHMHGRAMDIRALSGRTRWIILTSALRLGIKRVGIAKSFIHVDNDSYLPQEVIWPY